MDEIFTGTVSCRNLGWIFDLCIDRHINPLRILKHIPRQRDILQDPTAYIDWDSFLTLFSNLGNYLGDEQLMASGTESWKHPAMLPHAISGRLLRNARAQFETVYGQEGLLTRIYPVRCDIDDIKYGHIRIRLEMQANLLPCRTFQVLLAGQMAGLTTALGEAPATVNINQATRGAVYDVRYQPVRGPVSRIKRLLDFRAITRDCAKLLDESRGLLIDYENRLRNTEQQHTALEQNFHEQEVRCRLLERNTKDVVITLDESLNIRYISDSIDELCGYQAAEAMKLPPLLLFTEESMDKIRPLLDPSSYPRAEDTAIEVEIYRKNGERLWVEFLPQSQSLVMGQPRILTALMRNISERKRYEADLSEQGANYRAITSNALNNFIKVPDGYRIDFVAPQAADSSEAMVPDVTSTALDVISSSGNDQQAAPVNHVTIRDTTRGDGSADPTAIPERQLEHLRRPPARKVRSHEPGPATREGEMILLVEDDPQVRELARLVLISSGYRIVEAEDGIEALEIFHREKDEIALVIMDFVMPRIGGREVMARLRQIRPDIRILITSRYSRSVINARFIFDEGLDFIEKPYDAESLRELVRGALIEQPHHQASSEMILVSGR